MRFHGTQWLPGACSYRLSQPFHDRVQLSRSWSWVRSWSWARSWSWSRSWSWASSWSWARSLPWSWSRSVQWSCRGHGHVKVLLPTGCTDINSTDINPNDDIGTRMTHGISKRHVHDWHSTDIPKDFYPKTEGSIYSKQSWARNNFLASRQRHYDNAKT